MFLSPSTPSDSIPLRPRAFLTLAVLGLVGCGGAQSALNPSGKSAETIAQLFWWMASVAAIIWVGVAALCIYSIRGKTEPHDRKLGLFIIGGGAALPTVVLGVLLAFGLSILPELIEPAPEGSPHIVVTGEQWWWRVRYETSEGEFVELANEIHLPVGEPVQFSLDSADVIHAFWVPSLGGKVDMIPGRTNRLRLDPTRTGVFRGVCAEYCGGSHALMAFLVVVEERDEYERWLEHQQTPAAPPRTSLARRGQEVFLSSGCGACHTVRGTEADGAIGPDLTHLGSRQSLAAAVLPNEPDALRNWLAHTESIKPDVIMPNFDMLSNEDLEALAAYLKGLD